MFDKVVSKKLTEEKGVIIGEGLPTDNGGINDAKQNAIYDKIEGKRVSDDELKEMVDAIKDVDAEGVEQQTLLGTETIWGNVDFDVKPKLIAEVKSILTSDKGAFNKAIKNETSLKRAGNILNTESNMKQKQLIDTVLEMIDKGKNKSGDPINGILNKYVQQVRAGMSNSEAARYAEGEIVKLIEDNKYLHAGDNKSIIESEEIEGKKLTPFDTEDIIKARESLKNIEETYKINTSERQKLREDIADKLYGEGARNKNRRADIVIGPPAAGKSSVLVKPLVREHGSLVIDSDDAKEMLPEFNGGIGAGAVHKESSDIVDLLVYPRALVNGDNIVLPLVGKNANKIRVLKDYLNSLGYEVHLHINELPPEKAAQSAITRFKETGRFVDPYYVLYEVGNKPVETYEILKNEGGFASYERWSNDVEIWQPPKLIEKIDKTGSSEMAVGRAGGRLTFRGDQESNRRAEKGQEIKEQLINYHPEYKDDKEALKLAEEAIQLTFDIEEGNIYISSVKNAGVDTTGWVVTRGLGISAQFIKHGKINLIGQEAKTPRQVAALAQVFRDPRYETFRIIYTKDGKVVDVEGRTSRVPNSAKVFFDTPDKDFAEIASRMDKNGADGYYLLHNHPSGEPKPSKHDIALTERFSRELKGFLGHVVINHGKYAVIDGNTFPDGYYMDDLNLTEPDKLLTPSIPNQWLGTEILSDYALAEIAKKVQTDNSQDVVLYTDAKCKVRAIQEMPSSMFDIKNIDEAIKKLRDNARKFGSPNLFIVNSCDVSTDIVIGYEKLVSESIATDVYRTNINESLRKYISPTDSNDKWMGEVVTGERVDEAKEKYTPSNYKEGQATWKGPAGDQPVKVIRYLGKYNGKEYVQVEGTNSGIPLDEIVYPKYQEGEKTRKWKETVEGAETTNPELKKRLHGEDISYDPITNKETLKFAEQYVKNNYDKAMELVKDNSKPTAESNAIAQVLLRQAQNEGRWNDAIEIIEATARKATTSGQAIQALSMWSKFTPEGMLKYAQKKINEANNELKKKGYKLHKRAELTPELTKEITDAMKKIEKMPDGKDKIIETAKVVQKIDNALLKSVWRKISTIQTMAQLLNLKTMGRNIIGNLVFGLIENVSNIVGVPFDIAISAITKGPRTTLMPSLKTQAKGLKKGFVDGVKEALAGIDIKNQGNRFEMNKGRTFTKGVMGGLETGLSLGLKAPDSAFYEAAMMETLRQLMKIAGVNEPTEGMEVHLTNAQFNQEKYENFYVSGKYKQWYKVFRRVIIISYRGLKLQMSSIKYIQVPLSCKDVEIIFR